MPLLLVPVLCLLVGAARVLPRPEPPQKDGRVVILGFDGADARTVRELMEKDPASYPNLARLAKEGTFAPLEVVVPQESPVSWASLNSGQNPAETGVPGFIRKSITNNRVAPGFGFIEKKSAELGDLPDAPFLARFSPATAAGLGGGVAFALALLVALLLFRKLSLALIVGLMAGGAGGFAAHRERLKLPASYPRTYNVKVVESFWDHLARAGVPTVVLDGAQSFDSPTTSGAKVLHGLGLPDARNEVGRWAIYTTEAKFFKREGEDTPTAGTIYRVDDEGGTIQARVFGPKNFVLEQELEAELAAIAAKLSSPSTSLEESSALSLRKSDLENQKAAAGKAMSIPMVVRLEGERAHVKIGEQEQTLAAGQWSEFYSLSFEMNPSVRVDAITRVRLVSLQPHFELLLNVLDIDPRNPPFWQPITSPHSFASELAADCGLFETYGWPTLTMPFKDEKIAPEVLLEDVEFTERWREVLTQDRLVRDDWKCLMSVFSTVDRVQHMTYQYYDSGHPLHKPEVAARRMRFFGEDIALSEAIPAIYRQMDRIIGDVQAKLRPEDTLLVISDHGFQSFRHQVHLNNWLIENGYLTMLPLTQKNRSALGFVDWSKTRAYALGLGFIYLNLEGREPNGIVARDEAQALMDEIKAKLLASTDPRNGQRLVSTVYFPKDIHSGPHLGLEADIIPGFQPPYRVGWSTSSGGVSTEKVAEGSYALDPIVTDNDSNWSGDHVSMDESQVRGVFLSNRKVSLPPEGVRALQIAPTALSLLGVPVPAEMDLAPLEIP
ncbi:MAG: alkaline phosphatase family protein [Planctomycetota bacterium]